MSREELIIKLQNSKVSDKVRVKDKNELFHTITTIFGGYHSDLLSGVYNLDDLIAELFD